MKTDAHGRATLLAVDDSAEILELLGAFLVPEYQVRVASTGASALRVARSNPRPELILLDVVMPDLSGYEVLAALRADPATADIPVIFVTSDNTSEAEERGLDLGAVDYITKPLQPSVVRARIRLHLELKRVRDLLRVHNADLEAEISRRMLENQQVQDVTIRALARLAETRDPESGNHIRRTQTYVRLLAEAASLTPRFAATLTTEYIGILEKSAPLHDIGKVGIPDHILLKPGPLLPEEWDVMRKHPLLGSEALEHAEQDVEVPSPFSRWPRRLRTGTTNGGTATATPTG